MFVFFGIFFYYFQLTFSLNDHMGITRFLLFALTESNLKLYLVIQSIACHTVLTRFSIVLCTCRFSTAITQEVTIWQAKPNWYTHDGGLQTNLSLSTQDG